MIMEAIEMSRKEEEARIEKEKTELAQTIKQIPPEEVIQPVAKEPQSDPVPAETFE